MRRSWWLALALAGCDAAYGDGPVAKPVEWAYPAPPMLVGPGSVEGGFGRGQVTEVGVSLGIAGKPLPPLRLPTVWGVPGDGPARAVAYGQTDGDGHAIELVDIDGGTVLWRDDKTCAGPIVGVTATRAVCADAKGVHAIALATGALEWELEATYLAIDGDRVAMAAKGSTSIVSAESGDEIAHVPLPVGMDSTSVVATCGPHEMYAASPDGKLTQLVDGKAAWTAPTVQLVTIDACRGGSLVVTEQGGRLVAVARATGKVTGELTGVRGLWNAEGDDVIVATASATLAYPRDLAGPPRATNLPPFGDAGGESIAVRGGVRLVRVTPLSAALVDAAGVRAYIALGELGAALGDRAIVAASWQGSRAETLHRRTLPVGPRPIAPPILAVHTAFDVPAELRDLPAPEPSDAGAPLVAAAAPAIDAGAIAEVALEPRDPASLYAVATARDTAGLDDNPASAIARADLHATAWRWTRTDACGPGAPVPVAFTRTAIVCAADSPRGATIRATDRATGTPRWEVSPAVVDRIAGIGDVVLAFAGDRARVLDAADGHLLGELASDDGAGVRAAAIARGPDTWVAAVERGAIVVRVPRAHLLPILAIPVRGGVRALTAIDDARLLVETDDGDAYVLDLRTRAAVAVPAASADLHVDHEWITAGTPGGPLYAPYPPPPPPVPKRPTPPPPPTDTPPPPIATPVPPPRRLGTAWQLALYAPGGGLGARNDFDLSTAAPRLLPAAARAPRAPFAIRTTPDPTAATSILFTLDPVTGLPTHRIITQLPGGRPFSTIVDGKPLLGMAVTGPLRIVAF